MKDDENKMENLIDRLLKLLKERFPHSVNWGLLFYGAAICLFGAFALFSFDGISILVGIGLLMFGGWVVFGVIKKAKTEYVLDRGEETIYAEIVDISHSPVCVNGSYTYTVTCRAGNRVFTKKTQNLMDMSYIGKKVAVRVSASNPDVFDIDIDHIFLYDPESGEQPEADVKADIPQNPALTEYSRRWNNSPPANPAEPDSNAAKRAIQETSAIQQTSPELCGAETRPYTPLDWGQTKSFLTIPYSAITLAGIFLIIALVFTSFAKNHKAPVFFVIFSPGLISLLISGLNLLKKYRLFRYGRQVRAKISSVRIRAYINGDPVYKAVCNAGKESFSGSIRLIIRDSEIVGKWVTVFVSRRHPKRYIIEGKTLGKEY